MDRKKHTYLVEVIYEQVTSENIDGNPTRKLGMAVQTYQFTDDNKEKARYAADKELQTISRYGMKLSGGSVIKSMILPSAIKQIGLVDLDKWELEVKEMAKALETSPEETVPIEQSEQTSQEAVSSG